MTNKTVLIVGPAGPQGKSYLKERLRKDGYTAIETEDISIAWINRYENGYYSNGLENGFTVINFTGKPFIKPRHNYVMPDEEYQKYIDYIEGDK